MAYPNDSRVLAEIEGVLQHHITSTLALRPVISVFRPDILTVVDVQKIEQDERNYGSAQASSTLLHRMRTFPGWLDCLVMALSHPDIKMNHVAQKVGRAAGLDDVAVNEMMERGQISIRENEKEMYADATSNLELTDCATNYPEPMVHCVLDTKDHDETLLPEKSSLQKKLTAFEKDMDMLRTVFEEANAELKRKLVKTEEENAELKKRLTTTEEENRRLKERLSIAEREKLELRELLGLNRAEEELLGQQKCDHVGFKASVPAGLPAHLTLGEKVTCMTDVTFNCGGHYDPVSGMYSVPASGHYKVILSHTQMSEDTAGYIRLDVECHREETGVEGAGGRGLECRTWTWGKDCWGNDGFNLHDRCEKVVKLTEGDGLWVTVTPVWPGSPVGRLDPTSSFFSVVLEK